MMMINTSTVLVYDGLGCGLVLASVARTLGSAGSLFKK